MGNENVGGETGEAVSALRMTVSCPERPVARKTVPLASHSRGAGGVAGQVG